MCQLCYKCVFVFGGHFEFMYFENATGGMHSYFYYVNFAGNSNNCQNKGLQAIIKIAVYISVFNRKCVIYRHIVPLKQNKVTFTIRYELFGVLCPPMTRCK